MAVRLKISVSWFRVECCWLTAFVCYRLIVIGCSIWSWKYRKFRSKIMLKYKEFMAWRISVGILSELTSQYLFQQSTPPNMLVSRLPRTIVFCHNYRLMDLEGGRLSLWHLMLLYFITGNTPWSYQPNLANCTAFLNPSDIGSFPFLDRFSSMRWMTLNFSDYAFCNRSVMIWSTIIINVFNILQFMIHQEYDTTICRASFAT